MDEGVTDLNSSQLLRFLMEVPMDVPCADGGAPLMPPRNLYLDRLEHGMRNVSRF